MSAEGHSASIARPVDWIARYKQQFERDHQGYDAFVISYPKSGRTWHRLALGAYLADLLGEERTKSLELRELCQKAAVPLIEYSHNGANFVDDVSPQHEVVASAALWRERTVLLMVRDPRDILVSAYHHAAFRDRIHHGSLSEFIRAPITGIEKIMTAYRRWHDQRHLATRFTVISYEGMLCDPTSVLKLSIEALGLPLATSGALDRAIAFCSFDNMRRYEEENTFKNVRLSTFNGDARGRKVRLGRRGSYTAHFTDDDLRFVEEKTESLGGDPFASHYETEVR